MKKKVICIHLLNDFSGSPKVLVDAIKTLETDDYPVDLITGNKTEGFLTSITQNHITYPYKRFKNPIMTLLSYFYSQAYLFVLLLKRYWGEDVTFYINTYLPFGAALAGKMMKKDVLYHIHETTLRPYLLKQFLRFVVRITADKIIFVSKYVADNERFAKIPHKVIYNATPPEFEEYAHAHAHAHQNRCKADMFNVLMICSLKVYKGVNDFVEIARLCRQHSIQFTLVLNANEREINHFFQTTHIPENVTLVSQQKNTIPFYEKTDLVLNLSRTDMMLETFGLTVIEALIFGIPVIVPPCGGPSEIVTNGTEGYLIDSREHQTIAKKIIELSRDESLYRTLSIHAKKRAEYFSYRKFTDAILSEFQ